MATQLPPETCHHSLSHLRLQLAVVSSNHNRWSLKAVCTRTALDYTRFTASLLHPQTPHGLSQAKACTALFQGPGLLTASGLALKAPVLHDESGLFTNPAEAEIDKPRPSLAHEN